MVFLRRWCVLTILLLLFFVFLSATEIIFGFKNSRYLRQQNVTSLPTYPYSLVTSRGSGLGSREGLLQLELSPGTFYRNRPNQRTDFFQINSSGFRGQELGSDGKPKLVLMGGSVAFGTGARSDAETVSGHLQRLLSEYEIINAGVIGYESGNEFALLSSALLSLKPRRIVDLTGWNDFVSQFSPADSEREMGFHGFAQIEFELERWSKATFAGYFARLIQVPKTLFRNTALFLWPPPAVSGGSGPARSKAIDVFVKFTELSRDLAAARGARYVWIPQPALPDPKNRAMTEQYQAFVESAAQRLKTVPIAHIDVGRMTPAMFLDPVHLTDSGSAAVAQHIAQFVRSDRN